MKPRSGYLQQENDHAEQKKDVPFLEKPQEQVKSRWKYVLDAVRSSVRLDQASVPLLSVTGTAYHLEKLDSQHRRGNDLLVEFNIWQVSKTDENFFTWLDKKEKNTGKYLPRMVYRTTENEREEIHVQWKEDKLFINDQLCDTTKYKGKLPGYAAFSLSPNNQLFLAEHKIKSDVHASLQGGIRVASAGMIKVEQGEITKLSNFSGHYVPGLRNLLYAVKNIPANCFSSEAQIIYQKQRFPKLAKRLKENKYSFMRAIGVWLSRRFKNIKKSRSEFIEFAEKKLEKKANKFIYKRDKKDNRYENTLYESYLAKVIIQNDETWRPLILEINQWIFDKISKHKENKKMMSALISALKKYTKIAVDKTNFLEISKEFLLESKDLLPTLMFHGKFFDHVHPTMKQEKTYQQLPTYQVVRSDNLFADKNRGMGETNRKLIFFKDYFYRSNAFGIMPDRETPADLSQYFENQPDKHHTKCFHKLNGDRISYAAAQRNREKKQTASTSFREEIIERDVALVSGTSGTTTKIITPLIDAMKLPPEKIKEYLMVRGAAVVAYGYHSMYEVMVLARNLGFPIEYNHDFYHHQFITETFKKSKAYKCFLQSYHQLVAAHIPQPAASQVRQHETFVRVKKMMETKSDEKVDSTFSSDCRGTQFKLFDRSKPSEQQEVCSSSLVIASPNVSNKKI